MIFDNFYGIGSFISEDGNFILQFDMFNRNVKWIKNKYQNHNNKNILFRIERYRMILFHYFLHIQKTKKN